MGLLPLGSMRRADVFVRPSRTASNGDDWIIERARATCDSHVWEPGAAGPSELRFAGGESVPGATSLGGSREHGIESASWCGPGIGPVRTPRSPTRASGTVW